MQKHFGFHNIFSSLDTENITKTVLTYDKSLDKNIQIDPKIILSDFPSFFLQILQCSFIPAHLTLFL